MDFGIQNEKENIAQISPVEDLMREHGILHRLLLIYKDIINRLQTNFPAGNRQVYLYAFEAANIIKQFIEEYHQLLEEEYIFPVLLPINQYSSLIQVLTDQHKAAKCTTDKILHILNSNTNRRLIDNRQLVRLMVVFIKMYEPHSAREDTVVFPAFHQMVPQDVYNRLGDKFEEIEEQKFGEGGFQKIERKVTEIEKALSIHDLDKFTIQC